MSTSISSKSTHTVTGGKVFLEILHRVGVRYLFANVGSYETGLYDALVETPGIQLINGLHEGIVISMTDGYHRASGELGVANVHSIAGTTQMAGQLYNAFMGHSALLVTAGFIENDLIHDEVLLAAPSGYQQSEIIRPLTKNSWQVRSTAGVYGFSQRAIQCALTPPEGPVYLAFPDAVMRGEVSVQELPARGSTPRRFQFLAPERDILEAVQMIIKAKSVVILAGDDLYRYGAREEAVELAETTGAACFSARPCFANFPTDHPLFGGAYSQIPHIFKETPDLLIFLGARSFGGLPTILFPPAPLYRRGLWIGSDAIDMARCERIEMGIVAHPKSALQQLLSALQDAASASWQQEISEPRRSRIKKIVHALRERTDPSAHSDNIPIHPARAEAEICAALPEDAVVVMESPTIGLTNLVTGPGKREIFRNPGGSLGWGVGGAAGVQLAMPDRPVILSIGDGSLMYSASGLWSYARYGLPVLTVVWNNRAYEIVRTVFASMKGPMKAQGKFFGTYLGAPDIDFVALAHAQGVSAKKVRRPDELGLALQEALGIIRNGRPYLLEVEIATSIDSRWHQKFALQRKTPGNRSKSL